MPAPARKSKPRPASPQPDAGVPLAEVTLTYSSGHVRFPGDQPKPTTVTCAQLARVLEWMARNAPGRPHAFAAPDILASRLRGLGRLCGLAAQAETAGNYPEDFVDALTLVEDSWGRSVFARCASRTARRPSSSDNRETDTRAVSKPPMRALTLMK